jgi:hypothetical protein
MLVGKIQLFSLLCELLWQTFHHSHYSIFTWIKQQQNGARFIQKALLYQPAQTWALVLFADYQDIIAYSEDNLQRGVFTLQIIAKNVEMEISPEKYEMMAFLRKDQSDVELLWITNVYNK